MSPKCPHRGKMQSHLMIIRWFFCIETVIKLDVIIVIWVKAKNLLSSASVIK